MSKTAFCFDLDSTLTRVEILPLIARELGLFPELTKLTKDTIEGRIPFETSFLTRCEILKQVPISRVQEVVSTVPLYEDLIDFINNRSNECFVITGNLDIWIQPLRQLINCRFFSSKARSSGDTLLGVQSILSKRSAITTLQDSFQKIIAVGDGMGDVEMLQNSDLGIAFGGTHDPITSLIKVADVVVYREETLCQLLKAQ